MSGDSLDELIEMMHSTKAEFNSEEMRDHIIETTLTGAPKNIPKEQWLIMYGCEIYKKMLINYLVYDDVVDVEYGEGYIHIRQR